MNLVMVIDMQNGVFAQPRYDVANRVARINQLTRAADRTLFIQHEEGAMVRGTLAWDLLPDLHRPADALSLNKTACDAFWQTGLAALLDRLGVNQLTVCGCATDYCVDTTIKVGASLGYRFTVAEDAHTTADRRHVTAPQLIAQHNEVWANLSGVPVPQVKGTEAILAAWRDAAR